MGWEKGKKRGPSPLTGKQVLDLDLSGIDRLLSDDTESPEVRFVAVMELLLDAMADSANNNVARVGTRLRTFWDNDMQETVIFTPIGGANFDLPPGVLRAVGYESTDAL